MTIRAWGGLMEASTDIGGFQAYNQPAVAVLDDGTFVITWTGWPEMVGTARVGAQHFDADGTRLGVEFRPTYPPTDHINEGHSTIAALSGGGFVIGFEHGFDGGQSDHTDPVFQLFNSAGTPSPARHVDGDFAPYLGTVPELANLVVARFGTGFVVAYHDPNSNSGDVALDIRNASGDEITHIPVVNSITAGDQRLPDATEIGGGHFVVVWMNFVTDVRARIFDAQGTAINASDILVNTTAPSSFSAPKVAALNNGAFVVSYMVDDSSSPESDVTVRARIFDSSGNPTGNEFALATDLSGSQFDPHVLRLREGGFVAFWFVDDDSIRGQLFDDLGNRVDSEFIVTPDHARDNVGDHNNLSASELQDGRIVVTWGGPVPGEGSQYSHAYFQIVDPRNGVMTGTGAGDTLYGNDTVDDQITGGAGNDKLYGLGGNDHLVGGIGNDFLDGGTGRDVAVFSGLRAAYSITSLGGGWFQVAGPDGTDVVRHIEQLQFDDQTVSPPPLAFTGPVSWTGAGHGEERWYTGDFNGDGKDDLMRYLPGVSGGDVLLSNGSAFGSPQSWTGAGHGDERWYVGDFNGDGKDDLMRYLSGASLTQVLPSTGSSFSAPLDWSFADHGGDGWYVGDFNGDGKDDLMRYVPGVSGGEVLLSTGSSFSSQVSWTGAGHGDERWYIGDFNGDGKDDLLRYVPGVSGAQVLLSTGSSFADPVDWSGAGHGDDGWYIGDFDGDGKDDLMRYSAGGAGSEVFLSTGTSFSPNGTWTSASHGNDGWYVGDFTGQGASDIFRYVAGHSGADMFLVG